MNELTNQQLLDQYHSCVGTADNVSCYTTASNKHTNLDTVLLIGGFILLVVIIATLYRLKYGGK